MISPTSADRLLYLCRSSDSIMITPCSKSHNVNAVTYKTRPDRGTLHGLTTPRSSLTPSPSSTTPTSLYRPQATATTTTTATVSSSSSSAMLSCATESIPHSGATPTSIEVSSSPSERSSPVSPTATSPVMKRRPSHSKRPQKSANRIATRRIISASHYSHIHPLQQHEQQQQQDSQPLQHSRSSAQSSLPCCPSRRPLSSSTPSRLGSVTEAILQDQLLPLAIHSSSASDSSLFCYSSSLSRGSRHDCLHSSRSRIGYQSTLSSPDKERSQTTSNVPDSSFTLPCSSHSPPSTSPSSNYPLAHTSSSSTSSTLESFQQSVDNVNNAPVRRSCFHSSTAPRCHSFDSHRAILQGGREESRGGRYRPLCSNMSTAELQSSVPMYPFSIQDHSTPPLLLPVHRPKVHTQGWAPDTSAIQSGPCSAPLVLSSRPWTPSRLSLSLSQPTKSSREGRGTGRRHSDGEAAWAWITQNPKEKIMARLRFASGSVSRSDTEALLPRRKSSTAWPPVMAMVNQGLVAAKRSADLDQQYRESAQAFGRDIDRDSSGVRKYEGTSPSASTTGTPPTKNPVSSYAMEICNPTPFEFDSFRMATPATTPNPTMTSDIVHCDIHQIANSQQHSPPLQQWRKQPRFRVKGRSRWRRVGEDYSSPSFQRHLSGARHSPSLETATSLKRRETELRQRQLSPRFLRFLEAKPLPVVRSISRATLRRRPSYRRSFKLFAVNANKPLPPIPTESNTSASDRSDLPKIKECIGSPVFENDSYHEATSNMACHQDRGNCNRQRDYCSTKEEVTMATTTHQQSRHIIHGEHVCDGGDRRPVTDGSDENGEELIALAQKKNDSSSPPSLAFPHIDHDGKDNEDKFNQNSVSARLTSNSTSGFPSASTAAVLPVSIAPIAATTDSSTVAVVTSAKRLESFRFPMRKSPIEKHTPTRLRLHQHSHHQSLPYNTTHSRVLGKALDVHSLSPSDLIQNSRPSSSNTSSRTTSPGLDVVAGLGTTGSSRMLTGHDIKDLNAITATDYDGTAAIPATPLTTATTVGGKHESGSEKRSHRRHGPQRLKRSESCGYISYHRPSLSFNSSKKALLSLQDRRINKPDAKVRHRLPDIRTTAQTATTTAVVVISGGMAGIYSDDDFRTADALPSSSGLTNIGPMPSSSRISGNSALGHIGQDENGSEIEVETVLRTARVSCDDLVDYQIQVSDKDQSRIEAMHADEGRIQQTSQGRDVTGVSTNEPREDLNSDIPLPLSNTVIAAEPAPEHESGLGPALETFTIDPNPVIDAGEIKRFVKRSHALLELETTEESYVNDLDILVHVYLRILESRSWFPQIILAKMRRCVSGLLALHRDFHSKLEANKVDDLDREQQAPLKVYRDLAESFRALDRDNSLYSTFCELRMRTVKEINRSAGQATMTLLQRESKELMAQQGRPSSRADLKDFLIKPIQRVCRYPLLLKEILRLTSEDDPEYQYIDQAYRLMKDKAREMDETQRVVERKLLTEQFLKKLPETSFPRKVGITTTLASKEHSSAGGNGSSNNDGNATNGGNYNAGQFNIHSLQHCTASPGCHYCGNNGPRPSPGGMSDSYFDFGPAVQEGLAPAPLTKAFAGTLGSIVLAGALEYVITPDMPIRLKYYGCFLFETVLIVVKAKKSSLYEPRLWLPLRLCELQETTRLDGYTRFGWRIVYDQFRVDFGASCDAEQQVWVSTLQDRIQTAKDAYSKLPREIAAFETIISSLPWKLNNKTHTSHNNQIGSSSLIFGASSLGGLSSSTRHLHVCQQSPSPSLSPWSSCSSAIPSPLMPPPPLSATAPSSNGTTMMMAMSSMVTIEPEKWNACGSGPTWDSHTYRRQSQHENHSTQPHPSELSESHNASSYTPRARVASCGGDRESIRIGGMVGSGSLDREHADQYQQPPSASSSSTHSLYPATSVMPWLLPETRTRSHSFDVTRVFTSSTSSHNSIKPNQRALVQSMFKDVSTENIWTTTSVSQRQLQQGQGHLQLGQLGQPSPQPTSALSLSRYGSASPLSYFHSMTTSTNNNNAGMVPLSPSMGNIGGGLYSLKDTDTAGGWNTGGEDEGGSSSTVSLTSRLLRRRGSGDRAKCAPGGAAAGCQEKGEKDRRRNSATATIAGTLSLNFRKNSDPQQHSNSSSSGHRRHPSIPEAFVAAAAAAAATGTQDDHHMKSQESAQGHSMSVKARAQVIEKKSSSLHDAFLTSVTSSSSLSKMKIKSKVCSLHLRSHKESSSSLVADDEDAVATIGSGMATRDRALSMGGDMEILDTLSSVGEIARSRRGGSERIARKGVSLGGDCGLKLTSSSHSLPATLRSANSSASSLISLQPLDTTKESVENIWTAMGRMIHKSGRSRNNSLSSGENVSPNDAHGCHSSQGQLLHHHHHQQQQPQHQRPASLSTTTGSTLLRRSSTVGSGRSSETSCTLTSSSTSFSSCSPTMAPHPYSIKSPCSPQYPKKSRLRADSISTIQSLELDTDMRPEPSGSCGTGSGALGKSKMSFAPPKLRLTPSVSITCSSSAETSPDYLPAHSVSKKQSPSSSSSSSQTQKKEHSHHIFFQHHNHNHDHRRQDTYNSQTQTQTHPQSVPVPSAPSHDRRKSLSILQNITHSASQKFRTLMWSPSGLRKRTVMSLSPIMMDHSSCTGGGTTDEEEAADREEKEDREIGERLSLPATHQLHEAT